MTTSMTRFAQMTTAIAAFVYLHGGVASLSAMPPPPICEEVCSSSTTCSETCYLNMMEFENGNDITCLEYGVYDTSTFCCGDAVCTASADETLYTCAYDCGVCGDGYCDPFETCSNCATDCETCLGAPSCTPEDPADPTCGSMLCNSQGSCCSGYHVCTPDPRDPSTANCPGCSACGTGEVCRPSVNGNVFCITAGDCDEAARSR